MTSIIAGQKDHYKKLCGLQPLKRAHKKIVKQRVVYNQNYGIVCKGHFVLKIILGGQNDHLKKLCGCWLPKKAHAKN